MSEHKLDQFSQFFEERMAGKYDGMQAKAAKLAEVENEKGKDWREISEYLRNAMVARIMVDQGYLFDRVWYRPEKETPDVGASEISA